MTEKAQAAHTAAKNGRTKELYDIRQLSGRGPRKTAAITKKDGTRLKSKEDRQARGRSTLRELGGTTKPDEMDEEDEEIGEGELDINTEPLTEEEIKRVVHTLKNGKAPGIDQITAELLKVDTGSTCVELRRLFDLIWKEENCRSSRNRN